MDLIYTAWDFANNGNDPIESGVLKRGTFDCDIDDGNDFSFLSSYDVGDDPYLPMLIDQYIFLEGTEYGGLVTNRKIDKQARTIELSGLTFRGYLDTKVVIVPSGRDFYTVNADLRSVIRELFRDCYMPSHWIIDDVSNITVTYQFDRYCTLSKALNDLCEKYKLKMMFRHENDGIHFSIVKLDNLTREVELSKEDYDHISLTITQKGDYPNFMIALGKGELQAREVLYLSSLGGVNLSSRDAIYEGARIITYENTSSDNLLTDATNKFNELMANFVASEYGSYITTAEINSYDDSIELDIGDIVNIFEPIFSVRLSVKITGKLIRKVNQDKEVITYKFTEVHNG